MSDPQIGLSKPPYQKSGGEPQSLPLVLPSTLQSGTPSMTRLGGVSQGGRVPTRTPSNNGVTDNSMMAALLHQTNHPNLVNSLTSPNSRKRRLQVDDLVTLRRKVAENHYIRLKRLQSSYAEHVALLCFLQANGHQADYTSWRTRLPTVPLNNFLRTHKLNAQDDKEDLYEVLESHNKTLLSTPSTPGRPVQGAVQNDRSSPGIHQNSSLPISRHPNPVGRPPSSSHSRTPQTTPGAGDSQEQIVERAKQEAYVMQRIGELQKDGLWAEKRLPKVHELPRVKAHWDYLLEEMAWLSSDFAQERKWKKSAAKKCARMVQKYFQEKEAVKQKAAKAQEMQLKRIASFIAREVKVFWTNVEKLVEYKQQTRLEEKRKKALDQHLSFIVDQTEKYSSLVAESMNTSAPSPAVKPHSDEEFEPEGNSEDDEETIAKEEAMSATNKENVSDEIDALKRESELPLEDLLSDYLEKRDQLGSPQRVEEDAGDDGDFQASGKDSSDDEETIQEQEMTEGKVDYDKELKELEDEGSMNIDDLKKKYGLSSSTPSKSSSDRKVTTIDLDSDDDSEDDLSNEDDDDGDDEEDESEEEQEQSEDDAGSDVEQDSVLKTLIHDGVTAECSNEDKDKALNDAAAIAQSLQPKGYTLSSTSVVTKVPFLLKHSLREYQHVGLDWLVTMYERKLNGILADEMGLGKTIQTIALLAHLACEKGNWGPHLIVVPTSVMLNWEMEIKKWCPAFKILTYYGTQKERKLKRSGWTKPNAFHICITSYKLVIQDHQSFRRKKWKYLILDEAQNIKNFKSQRWQLLLNFQTQRRLLLTGTPLQNNLMELWSLMHFLMPDVFESHREFKEWFSNPVTGMIEGSSEYNENIIKRLHKVLRPFLLRRLKSEVETQMPKKYEHVVMCRLSNRQRYLYDDFMSRAKTRETLASGNLLSVINVLMQLRKVCNHPNLFEVRPTVSPFQMERVIYTVPSLVYGALDYDPFKRVDLGFLNLLIIEFELWLLAFVAHRTKRYKVPSDVIINVDSAPPLPPPCPKSRLLINVSKRPPTNPVQNQVVNNTMRHTVLQVGGNNHRVLTQVGSTKVGTSPLIRTLVGHNAGPGVTLRFSSANAGGLSQCLQLLQQPGGVKAISLANSGQVVKTSDGTRVVSSIAQFVTTPAGKQLLLSPQVITSQPGQTVMAGGQRLLLSKAGGNIAKLVNPIVTQLSPVKPTMKVPPLNISTSSPSIVHHNNVGPSHASSPSTATTNATAATNALTPSSTPTSSPAKNTRSPSKVKGDSPLSSLRDDSLLAQRRKRRMDKLAMLARVNETRVQAMPLYGVDLVSSVSSRDCHPAARDWRYSGYVNCLKSVNPQPRHYWENTEALQQMIYSVEDRVVQLSEIFSRFVLYVPAVAAPTPAIHVPHPAPWKATMERRREAALELALKPKTRLLHPISSAMSTQFPDPRLIQYDCGKLQSLDRLLRQLKTGHHRVLIFTQMTRMLDVLEAFLNFHGHIYLRLDGTTKVEQRQLLMERFNADKRIFCFILSTRSGGVGINLTGADTVVFYDSDWNPTMDAQAQDRCHRIGQTRDVHIYRLISEKTVEENILKKANQKRMLGDVAIEGGNFTTAYFKSTTIQDLFNVDTNENDATRRMADVLQKDGEKPAEENTASTSGEERSSLGALESALAQAEDDTDVAAAKVAKAEAAAELAEFDENIPLEAQEPELSKAEQELNALMQQLSGVEKYAMNFVERSESVWSAERLAAAEAEIEMQKLEWERGRLAAIREDDKKKKAEEAESDDMITYSGTDARNQVWVSNDGKDIMPMWGPPTPPQGEGDVYIDHNLGLLYEQKIIPQELLPPIYIKKEKKRTRIEAGLPEGRVPVKVRPRDDALMHVAPRSLFDRPSPALIKMRQEMRHHRHRGTPRPVTSLVKPVIPVKLPPEPDYVPDWTIQEDYTILQSIQNIQELTLNLVILSPGHTPNWDMVADMVNHTSRTYRSPKQCKNRYESVIIPREEGKLVLDSPKKQKKKSVNPLYKMPLQMKSGRPLRTAQLYSQDGNSTMSQIMNSRFESIRSISNRRAPTTKPLLVNPGMKNPKHAEILAECSIDYDNPLTPVEVASKRADRIAKEKALSQNVAATPEQQLAAIRLQQLQSSIAKTTTVTNPTVTSTTSARPVAVQEIMASPMARGVASSPTTQSVSTPPRGAAANVVSVQSTPSPVGKAATTKAISPAQIQLYRQQQILRQQQLRVLQSQRGAAGQKVPVATVTSGSPTTQRVQQVQVKAAGLTRTVSESEMLALLKRQQVAKVTTATTIASAQLLAQAQASLQAQQASSSAGVGQVTTLVKTVPATSVPVANLLPQMKAIGSGIKAGTVTQQQIQQLAIRHQLIGQQRKFSQQKVAQIGQVATKAGTTAQLIVQSPKSMPTTMTMQQIQQVMKHVNVAPQHVVAQVSTAQVLPHTVFTKAQGASQPRVIPVASSSQQPLKQSIQVVTASSAGTTRAIPSVTIDASGRATATGTIAGTIKTGSASQQAILTQVSAVLQQGQPITVRQPVRIQAASAPLVAVAVSQAPTLLTLPPQDNNQNQQH